MGMLLLQVLLVSTACGGSSSDLVEVIEAVGLSAEKANVQNAIDLLMADAAITVIDAKKGRRTSAVKDWTGVPKSGGSRVKVGGSNVDLADYMMLDSGDITKYWYCYDTDGRVLEQRTSAGKCS